ncbi:hypothetical protein MHU86_12790 [Fragilaria crotonensis]|nr:hypothetical protein MHU86_12790 [Fragilaria crotonensis]
MLLQLSEWQVTTTSLSIAHASAAAVTKRRRSKSTTPSKKDNRALGTTAATSLPAALSFVPPGKRLRPSKRKKGNHHPIDDQDLIPTLAVTTAHGITVLGTSQSPSNSNSNSNTNNGDSEESLLLFRESNKLQYTSRPGNQTSFIAPDLSGTMTNDQLLLPSIPAFVDAKNDRVYALQGGNSIVVSWRTDADDTTTSSATKFTLPKPAMSMSVVSVASAAAAAPTTTMPRNHNHQVLVYGTLCDHRFYVGTWSADGTMLHHYIFNGPTVDNCDGLRHVCTVIAPTTTNTATTSSASTSGSKRKSSEPDGKCVLTQVFVTHHGLMLLNHQLLVTDDSVTCVNEETRVSRLSLVSQTQTTPLAKNNDVSIDIHQVLHARAEDSLVVAYQQVATKEIVNGKKQHTEVREHKACRISLVNGVLLGEPFEISGSIRHVGFVSDNLLAAGTIDAILLYEVDRGILIRSISVSDVVADTKDWIMITDNRKSRIALLTAEPKHPIRVAMTTVMAGNGDTSQGPLQLAHLLAPSTKQVVDGETNHIHDNDAAPAATAVGPHAVQDALASLHACIESILDPKDEVIKSTVLLDAYERALAQVLPPKPKSLSSNNDDTTTNGNTTTNPTVVRKSFDNETLSNRGETPSSTPQEFIDGAMRLVLVALQLPRTESKVVGIKIMIARLDARLILYRLIRSGKVSARCHFQQFQDAMVSSSIGDGNVDEEQHHHHDDILLSILRATKLSNKRGRRVVSPVDLMHEMLSNCTDLTERHLVTMLHYMMCKALPHDIAENCLGWKCFDSGHPYKMTSRAYFQAKTAERNLQNECFKNKDIPFDDRRKEIEDTIETISTKILRIGLLFLVERVVSYSKLNTSLLRTALSQGLVHRSEAPTLARILLHIMTCSGNSNQVGRMQHARTKATAQWIAVLCEACRDTLSSVVVIPSSAEDDESSQTQLEYILERLEATLEDSTAIMSLGPSIESVRGSLRYDADAVVVGGGSHKTEHHHQRSKKEVVIPTKLAGYCIEQLIL